MSLLTQIAAGFQGPSAFDYGAQRQQMRLQREQGALAQMLAELQVQQAQQDLAANQQAAQDAQRQQGVAMQANSAMQALQQRPSDPIAAGLLQQANPAAAAEQRFTQAALERIPSELREYGQSLAQVDPKAFRKFAGETIKDAKAGNQVVPGTQFGLPEGSFAVADSDGGFVRYIPPQKAGMRVTATPDGGVEFSSGGPLGQASESLTSTTVNRIDQEIQNLQGTLAGLDRIEQNLERVGPDALRLSGKAKATAQRWLDFLGQLPPEQQKELQLTSEFRSSTGQLASQIINSLSGAAVSPQEFKRLEKFVPNDGDTPAQFLGKLKNLRDATKASELRMFYARKMGWRPHSEGGFRQMNLAQFQLFADKRQEELLQQYAGDAEAAAAAFREEFGIP